jgi:hypothetical protein
LAIDSAVFGYKNAAAVTPNDNTDLTNQARALYIGGTGNLVITPPIGGNVTFVAVPVGTLLPIQANRVLATGTTATNIVALW